MGLLDKIKTDIRKSGQNKGKFMYFRQGVKTRVRFLQDMDEGIDVTFHDSFEKGINVPCLEQYGKACPYCEKEGLRTRSQYIWSVYDYEAKEVKLLMSPVNNCTPVPALIAIHENYGTLVDRDYVITSSGVQANKTFSVIPMDKVKFKNEAAKPYTKKAIMQMVAKAWPYDEDVETDSDDEEVTQKKQKPASSKVKQPVDEEDEWDDEEDDDVVDYSKMSARELYTLCKERGIDVLPKKSEKYYTKNLEEADKTKEDWDDEDDDDEWEEE